MTSYQKERPDAAGALLNAAKGLAVGVIVSAVLIFIFSAIAYSSADPDKLTSPLGYAALYISALAAGAAGGRASGETGGKSAVSGAGSGLMLLLFVILLSFIPLRAPQSPLSPAVCAVMYAAVPAVAAAGGFLFRIRAKRKPVHRRKHR